MAKLGQHGVAELCLLATQWGSLWVAAMRPKLGMASTAWASERRCLTSSAAAKIESSAS